MIGGIENYVMSLALAQQKTHDVSILTLNRSFIDGNTLPATGNLENIKIIRIPYKGSNRYPLALGTLKYLKDFDIIHIHAVDFFIDFIAFSNLFYRKKIILTTHGGFFHTPKNKLLKKLFFNTVTRFSIKCCYRIIACGDNDYDLFSKLSGKVIKIDNGVNVNRYLHQPKKVVPGELLYVGRIDTHKRIDQLIRATHSLLESGENVHLRIIGPDWNHQKKELLRLVYDLGISKFITFEGAVSDSVLIEACQTAHVFLSASEYEGFGIAAVEALASGTLGVVHPNDSFKKLFPEKPFIILSDYNDSSISATRIKNILNLTTTEYHELSEQARNFSKTFSWDLVAQTITDQYN